MSGVLSAQVNGFLQGLWIEKATQRLHWDKKRKPGKVKNRLPSRWGTLMFSCSYLRLIGCYQVV